MVLETTRVSPDVGFFGARHLHDVLCGLLSDLASESCTLSRPSWAPTAAAMYTSLPHALANRTMLYLGDSLSFEEYLQMASLVAAHTRSPGAAAPLVAPQPSTRPPHECGVRLHALGCFGTGCRRWRDTGFQLCYVAAGRKGTVRLSGEHDWAACFDPDLVLGDALACAYAFGVLSRRRTRRDVVIANAGAHHERLEGLVINVQSLLGEIRGGSRGGACVLWRESFPQHFNTTTGTFGGFFGGDCFHGPQCRSIAPQSLGTSRQMFNDVSGPLIERAAVPMVRVFRATLPFWQLHPNCYQHASAQRSCDPESPRCLDTVVKAGARGGGPRHRPLAELRYMAPGFVGPGKSADCTHFPFSPVHEFARVMTLNAVEQECS